MRNKVPYTGGEFNFREAGQIQDRTGKIISYPKALVIQQGNKSLALNGYTVRALIELFNSDDADIQHFIDTLDTIR